MARSADEVRDEPAEGEPAFEFAHRLISSSAWTLTVPDGRFDVEELTFREELPDADRP